MSPFLVSRSSFHVLTIVTAALLMNVRDAAGQTLLPREVAAFGALPAPLVEPIVNETAIAAGPDHAMAVYHLKTASTLRIGYALWTRNGSTWSLTREGALDDGGYVLFSDPTVAFDDSTGDFLIAAMGQEPGQPIGAFRGLLVARWKSTTDEFTDWLDVNPTAQDVDKPWIVAGEYIPPAGPSILLPTKEFYIVWQGSDGFLKYVRTRNGFTTWKGGDCLTNVNDPNTRIANSRWPVVRVHDTRPPYVAHIVSEGPFHRTIAIEIGTDINSGPHAGEVQWTTQLDDSTGSPLAIVLNSGSNMQPRLPGGDIIHIGTGVGVGVDFAVAPSNPDQLYLAYHDVDHFFPIDPDVNIYLQTLTRVTGNRWAVGPRILVADDANPTIETDQFMPQIAVDDQGRVHVTWLGDENFTNPDQIDTDSDVKFDAFYARSINGGQTWTVSELCDDPPACQGEDAAVDSSLPNTEMVYEFRDYNGIAVGPDRVWTSFMGISTADPSVAEKSVIWSSQILPD
jgi:hypothetical protein